MAGLCGSGLGRVKGHGPETLLPWLTRRFSPGAQGQAFRMAIAPELIAARRAIARPGYCSLSDVRLDGGYVSPIQGVAALAHRSRAAGI